MAKSKLLGNTVRTLPRRLALDMAVRTDAILDREIFTSIVHSEMPSSILNFFGRGFGDITPVGTQQDNADPWFQIQTSGISSSYINIKEESEKQDPLRVYDNSKVPVIIPANTPFDITFDRAILDDDENFHCRDQKTMGRVVSRRIGNGSAEYTVMLNGGPGATFPGSLFRVNDPVIYGMGNSQGEFSAKSNTIPGDSTQYNTFFNPTMITRYVMPVSGSFMADEMYMVDQEAMDGTRTTVNTGIPKIWMRKVLHALEHQMLYSTSNFDPKTKTILGRSFNSRYPERPAYAGFYEMMDQSPVQYLHQMNDSYTSGLQKIDRIMQTMWNQPGSSKVVVAFAQGVGASWIKKTLREGGLASSPIRINVVPEGDKITVGFVVDKYVTDYGTLYLKEIGRGQTFSGEYDLVTHDGQISGPRGKDIFFFNGTREEGGRPKTKVAKYFTKEGQVEGFGKVNRGFVFGISKGITGEGNGWTGSAAQALTENSIDMLRNQSQYALNSTVDGNEYHCLVEGVPYFDARGTIKLSLF